MRNSRIWTALVVTFAFLTAGCATTAQPVATRYVVPEALTTTYGKGYAPVGIKKVADGDVICDPDHAGSIVLKRSTKGRSLDEGQSIFPSQWPALGQKGGEIVLVLARDDGSVWSYRAVIARKDGKVIGKVGGLQQLGVTTHRLIIRITVGDDIEVPDELELCRLTDGVG